MRNYPLEEELEDRVLRYMKEVDELGPIAQRLIEHVATPEQRAVKANLVAGIKAAVDESPVEIAQVETIIGQAIEGATRRDARGQADPAERTATMRAHAAEYPPPPFAPGRAYVRLAADVRANTPCLVPI